MKIFVKCQNCGEQHVLEINGQGVASVRKLTDQEIDELNRPGHYLDYMPPKPTKIDTMKTTISISIADLSELLECAERKNAKGETNGVVEITRTKEGNTHSSGDNITAVLRSGWAECCSTWVYSNDGR